MNDLIKIPAKSTFKLNEVCQITGVKPYVLKFWEEQFDEISPVASATGQKLYEHQDIQAIALVKKLLFEEKLCVDSAKSEIKLRMIPQVPEIENENQEVYESNQKRELVTETLNETTSPSNEIDMVDNSVQADLEEFSIALKEAIDIEDSKQGIDLVENQRQDSTIDLSNEMIEVKEESAVVDTLVDTPRIRKKVEKSILCDKDKQNLVLAKAKLQNMLMLASQIQERESWH